MKIDAARQLSAGGVEMMTATAQHEIQIVVKRNSFGSWQRRIWRTSRINQPTVKLSSASPLEGYSVSQPPCVLTAFYVLNSIFAPKCC